MSTIRRGVKNTFRNPTRAVGIILILSIAFGLSISMLVARQSSNAKINSTLQKVGNTITVSPAGSFGFVGGGSPLPASDVTTIAALTDVSGVDPSLATSLTASQTSLKDPNPGGGQIVKQFGGGGGQFSHKFTPSIRVEGTNSPGTVLENSAAGGGTETLTSGTSFGANSTKDVAVVGKNLAKKNSLSVGSTFTAWSTTFTVVGIYDAGSSFANSDLLVPLATAQKLSGQTGDVNNITVTVNSLTNVNAVQTKIQSLLGSAANVTSQATQTEDSLSPITSIRTIATISLIATIIAAGVILLLSMLMIVRERRRETGVLKALGASNRVVLGQFVAESTTFTFLSGLVGLGLGIVLANPITSVLGNSSASPTTGPGGFTRHFSGGTSGGFTFGGPPGAFTRNGFSHALTSLHASASWSTLVIAFLIALGVAVVGSSLAAINVVRIRPAEVLRSE